MKSVPLILAFLLVIVFSTFAAADSLQLRDGRHFDGKYVGGTEGVIAFFTQGSTEYFPVNDVLLVVFGSSPQSMGPLGKGDAAKGLKPSSAVQHKGSKRGTSI